MFDRTAENKTKFYPITPSHVSIMNITSNDNTESET